MKLTTTIIALAFVALVASTASAQTGNHFARQQREVIARQAAAHHHLHHQRHGGDHYGSRQWGGPTTNTRFYYPSHGQGVHRTTQYYRVNPYGNPYGYANRNHYRYGAPGYGFYGIGSPYYAVPYGASGVQLQLGR